MRSPQIVHLALCFAVCASAGNVVGQTISPPDARYSSMTILSEPPGAGVRVDSSYVGKTPVTVKTAKDQPHIIGLHRHGYLPFQCVIGPVEQDSMLIATTLEPIFGTASVFTEGPDYWISVDGKEVGNGRIDSLALPLGVHHLTIRDARFEREVSDVITVDRVHHVSVKVAFSTASASRLFKGLLLPGYGQLSDGSYLKGAAFSLSGVGMLVFMLSAIIHNSDAEGAYNDALAAYDRASNEYLAVPARLHADRMAAEYHTARDRMQLSVAGVALVWVANALDFAFNHALEDRIDVFAGVSQGQVGIRDSEYRICLAVRLP